jgi:hypothetical protein
MPRNIIFVLTYHRHITFTSYLLLFNDVQNSTIRGKCAEGMTYACYSCVQLLFKTIFPPIGKRAETPVDLHLIYPLFLLDFNQDCKVSVHVIQLHITKFQKSPLSCSLYGKTDTTDLRVIAGLF